MGQRKPSQHTNAHEEHQDPGGKANEAPHLEGNGSLLPDKSQHAAHQRIAGQPPQVIQDTPAQRMALLAAHALRRFSPPHIAMQWTEVKRPIRNKAAKPACSPLIVGTA